MPESNLEDLDESRAHVDPVIAKLLREKQEKDREDAARLAKIETLAGLI
jgi:hypothetical protein